MTEQRDPTMPALPDAEEVEAALEAAPEALPEEAVADTPAEFGTLEVEMERGVLLSARAVTKRFGGLLAVNAIDFDIPEGSIVSLIGPNGAGKTTFFNVIAGIYDPTAGHVDFRGRRMIARTVRGWLEPILWFAPALDRRRSLPRCWRSRLARRRSASAAVSSRWRC